MAGAAEAKTDAKKKSARWSRAVGTSPAELQERVEDEIALAPVISCLERSPNTDKGMPLEFNFLSDSQKFKST